jgi:hypothetical protein
MSNDAELVAIIRYPSFWYITNFTTYDLFLHIRVAYGLSGFSSSRTGAYFLLEDLAWRIFHD